MEQTEQARYIATYVAIARRTEIFARQFSIYLFDLLRTLNMTGWLLWLQQVFKKLKERERKKTLSVMSDGFKSLKNWEEK